MTLLQKGRSRAKVRLLLGGEQPQITQKSDFSQWSHLQNPLEIRLNPLDPPNPRSIPVTPLRKVRLLCDLRLLSSEEKSDFCA